MSGPSFLSVFGKHMSEACKGCEHRDRRYGECRADNCKCEAIAMDKTKAKLLKTTDGGAERESA